MTNTRTDKKQTHISRGAMIFVLSVIAIISVAGIGLLYVFSRHDGDAAWFYLPATSTPQSVKDSLLSALDPAQASKVYHIWEMSGGKTSTAHGAYRVEPGETALATAQKMLKGHQTPVKVTFHNIRTMPELMSRISSSLEVSADSLSRATCKVLTDSGFKPDQFPAAFIPDTYEFYWTTPAEKIVTRLLDYRNRFWNDDRTAKARALGLTPVEVATLASIVEEESNMADEQPVIARLYINRLNRGMPLQADPTVKFAVGDFTLRRITGSHLSVSSPFNTYLNKGLPPGPIRVAAKGAIDRVLSAPKHSYLYMCAKEDFSGHHNFAADYDTHRANARRYQKALNDRNIH